MIVTDRMREYAIDPDHVDDVREAIQDGRDELRRAHERFVDVRRRLVWAGAISGTAGGLGLVQVLSGNIPSFLLAPVLILVANVLVAVAMGNVAWSRLVRVKERLLEERGRLVKEHGVYVWSAFYYVWEELDDDELTASSYEIYRWDCPRCGNVNETGDVQPSGEERCDDCGVLVEVN